MPHSRQLAAIMFTDIVGYTALMGDDEDKAFDLLNKNRQLQKPLIEQFGGIWIKELGDGVMASFSSAIDAVICATAIIKNCEKCKGLQLRIGIHVGDVVFENGDVFGDGVNIAARLQSIASIGSIWISDAVQKNISNKKEISTKFIREERLKNVNKPMGVYEVLPHDLSKHKNVAGKETTQMNREKSLAVLPFTDMSPAHDQEYLGDGLAEELINVLSQLKELKVIGRTSSFSFKNKEVDLKTIGKALSAENILEGSLQKAGIRIRITAQLVNAEDGYHIWSKRYDREIHDIFALQDDICSKIAEHLKITLIDVQEKREEKKPTSNLQAYELFLKGRFWLEKGVEGILKAMDFFKQAVEIDPSFADSWLGLGFTYFQAQMYLFLPAKEANETARNHVHKAIALGEQNADAHLLLAAIHLFYDRDWEKAKQEIELSKQHSHITNMSKYMAPEPWYYSMLFGDFDRALSLINKSIENDPLSTYYLLHYAYITLIGPRHYDKARTILNKILELEPAHSEAFRLIGLSYLYENKVEKAEEYIRKANELTHGRGYPVVNLIMCLAASGKPKEATEKYETWKATTHPAQSPAFLHIIINAYLGNFDESFAYFEKAFSEHDFWLISLKYSPQWDLLRPDPRFQNVLGRMNFPS